ncbi:MAG: hypothetical protein ACJ8E1_22865, partial [Xanthobacteraceae bacterium]
RRADKLIERRARLPAIGDEEQRRRRQGHTQSHACLFVITGLVPLIPLKLARPSPPDRDCRDKPGNDEATD